MKLEDWLDDLCVRFIINLPKSELESVERICFQVEEAQWFYEDFIRPLDPSLPSLNLRAFSLKIFQHCSLFSQWSREHHMSAFAEFLAYKQRVPVRGAIMLNEDMDQVVLVKGWKKGANWSFPRGKINKDENDLDCAVREVYEETGFDIRDAGLVKDENEMKYIEVTMREQHMRLYVFRGVPMSTHFEPRTRKEISKIEWYKLTDLPTLKKHKHQDSNGQPQAAVNANKFYMVAPFLNPLKKWISQQRRDENRQSLPYLAPPIFSEEISHDESEHSRPQLQKVLSHGPSNLPEVAYAIQEEQDPSADLKRMLNINVPPAARVSVPEPNVASRSDAAKSSALLALLRTGSTAEMRDVPHTPREQISFPLRILRSPHQPHPQAASFSAIPSPPRAQMSPGSWQQTPSQPQQMPTDFRQRQDLPLFAGQPAPVPSSQGLGTRPWQEVPNANLQRFAPYQNTGDPQFSRATVEASTISAVPPASALPKLTSHTKTLLDAFKLVPSLPLSAASPEALAKPAIAPQAVQLPTAQTQTLLDIFNTGRQEPSVSVTQLATVPSSAPHLANSAQAATTSNPGQRQNLLNLFQQPAPTAVNSSQAVHPSRTESQPAELAADVVASTAPQAHGSSSKEKSRSVGKKHDRRAPHRESETAATVNGPLNQPQFDGIVRSVRKVTNGDRRSPVPANKTLYDHRNPTPVKILARPEDTRASPARSPKVTKVAPSISSPRRAGTPKESKESVKPFHPQILRRPQTPSMTTVALEKENVQEAIMSSASIQQAETRHERPSQADSHRQALLSLFNKPLQTSQTPSMTHDPVSAVSNTISSPLTAPQHVMPISTRSRVGSLASAGGAIRSSIEKRQTAAGDKAFLLGYLGRIASQEGQ